MEEVAVGVVDFDNVDAGGDGAFGGGDEGGD